MTRMSGNDQKPRCQNLVCAKFYRVENTSQLLDIDIKIMCIKGDRQAQPSAPNDDDDRDVVLACHFVKDRD